MIPHGTHRSTDPNSQDDLHHLGGQVVTTSAPESEGRGLESRTSYIVFPNGQSTDYTVLIIRRAGQNPHCNTAIFLILLPLISRISAQIVRSIQTARFVASNHIK